MSVTTEPQQRFPTLDVLRGVAVMGILAMNIIAFALPFQAYMNPTAFGFERAVDQLSWLLSFILVDGKMRGLFSLLFGASMLLVIQRAEARNENAASVHFRRMGWLLLFGLIHLYFIWFGDILALYAMVGMLAWPFRRLPTEKLVGLGVALLALQFVIFAVMAALALQLQQAAAEPDAVASTLRSWQSVQSQFGTISGDALASKLALFRGDYAGQLDFRLDAHALSPITALLMFGAETLAYFLFGMAALNSGFLLGAWSAASYRKVVVVGLGIGIPAYAGLAWLLAASGFSIPMVIAVVLAATVPFRLLMIVAYAALIILVTRRSGWLTRRIAAAGRAAFTNYLGTSILMTSIFYGFGLGLFGRLGRAELWLVVMAAWILMLAWSKPWLDRFTYGPLEWLWRSLARGQLQPLRKFARQPAP